MNLLVTISLIIVGIIHVVPAIGVLGNQQLAMLYGLTLSDHNLSLLMRHRAVLFGLLGGLLIVMAFRSTLHWPALFIGLIATASFVLLALDYQKLNEQVARVVTFDFVCVVILIVAMSAKAFWGES